MVRAAGEARTPEACASSVLEEDQDGERAARRREHRDALRLGFGARRSIRGNRGAPPNGLLARNGHREPLGHPGLVLRRARQDQQASVGQRREVADAEPLAQRQPRHAGGGATPAPWAKSSAARAWTMNACPSSDGARSPNSRSSPSPSAAIPSMSSPCRAGRAGDRSARRPGPPAAMPRPGARSAPAARSAARTRPPETWQADGWSGADCRSRGRRHAIPRRRRRRPKPSMPRRRPRRRTRRSPHRYCGPGTFRLPRVWPPPLSRIPLRAAHRRRGALHGRR